MSDHNQVSIIGRLTRDAETVHTSGGSAILKGAIATDRSVKRGDKWEKEASFFDFVVFGKLAEWRAGMKKGTPVIVAGELRQERWEKDGQHYSRVVIVADHLEALAGREKGAAPDPKPAPEGDGFTDDIPF